MKKIILIIIFVVLSWGAYLAWQLPTHESLVINPETTSPTPTPIASKTIETDGAAIAYALIKTTPDKLTLIPNFTERKTSDELARLYSCAAGINGGFYDTDSRPLGLFNTQGKTLRGVSTSALINGFFSHLTDGTSIISTEAPTQPTDFSLQSGPLLMTNTTPRTLAIKNDEHARRMIAATTSKGEIIFMTLYEEDALYDGPLLGDTPTLVKKIAQKESLSITSAINLDGGSASSFFNGDVTLGELTQIGSFFCVKK